MKITLKIWRQKNKGTKGIFKAYPMDHVSPDMSFLEMLDVLNNDLVLKGEEPVAFDHDCREGICGMCSMVINGRPHGPKNAITTCQLHMRSFKDGACSLYINGRPHGPQQTTTCQLHMRTFHDGETITIEPWRAQAFPVIRDLVVDRSAFDRIQQAGGYVSVNTGGVPDANMIPIPKKIADEAFDSAVCIGCGACVAACKNASAMLFVSAKVSQLALLPQGKPERKERVERMVAQMDAEGFGACTNTGACEAECPKGISLTNIARMNREYFGAISTSYEIQSKGGGD
jgi:succinate dehydrogenase / fumarate reductase iron-sulfur subunit